MFLILLKYNFLLDRPSPRKEVRSNSQQNSSSTSFQDFQESVNDAWEIGDDEFCNILGKFFALNLNVRFYERIITHLSNPAKLRIATHSKAGVFTGI